MERLLQHIAFVRNSAGMTCRYLSGKEVSTVQLFCFGMLRRLSDSATASKMLLEQLNANPSVDFTIGITFRAILLDTLIVMNLYYLITELEREDKSAQEIETAVLEYCNNNLSDGIRQTLSYIQDAETFEIRTAEDTANAFNNMARTYQPFLEPHLNDGSKPIIRYRNQKTAKQLFENLAKSEDMREISKLYDSYAYFSKYDHFGMIYYHAINEPIETKINIYRNVAESFVAHNALLHVILSANSQNDAALDRYKDQTNSYLLQEVVEGVQET